MGYLGYNYNRASLRALINSPANMILMNSVFNGYHGSLDAVLYPTVSSSKISSFSYLSPLTETKFVDWRSSWRAFSLVQPKAHQEWLPPSNTRAARQLLFATSWRADRLASRARIRRRSWFRRWSGFRRLDWRVSQCCRDEAWPDASPTIMSVSTKFGLWNAH